MAGPIRRACRRDFDHLQSDEVATAAQLHERRTSAPAEPCPRRGLDRIEVEGDGFHDRNALAPHPFDIGIDEKAAVTLRHQVRHVCAGSYLLAIVSAG